MRLNNELLDRAIDGSAEDRAAVGRKLLPLLVRGGFIGKELKSKYYEFEKWRNRYGRKC